MSTPRFRPNPFTDMVPRRGATSSKAGLDTYRRLAAVEQTIGANMSVDTDSLNLYRAMGSGVLAWTYDPGYCINATVSASSHTMEMLSGYMYLGAVYLPSPATVTGVATYCTTAGVGTWTRGKIAILSATGTRLAFCNTDASLWKSTGLIQKPLFSPIDLDRGLYYAACLNVRSATTTIPKLAARAGYSDLQNLLTQTGLFRSGVITGQSDIADPYDLTTASLSQTAFWAAFY